MHTKKLLKGDEKNKGKSIEDKIQLKAFLLLLAVFGVPRLNLKSNSKFLIRLDIVIKLYFITFESQVIKK